MSHLTIVRLYHSLLGTYGDQGNAEVLIHRATSRNIGTELIDVSPGMPIPTSADVYLIGGGEDGPQTASLNMLATDGGLHRAVEAGATVFAVCAGFQMLGVALAGPDGRQIDGLGLVDAVTIVDESPRSVGELVIAPDVDRWEKLALHDVPLTLTGFENHQGLTKLGKDAQPLGIVQDGIGNGFDQTEGVWQGNIIGTYMHGPALARNPELADLLLTNVTGPLAPFDDELANAFAHERRATLRRS